MQTFAAVAVRLIGLWILASGITGVALLVMLLADGGSRPEMWGELWMHQVTATLAPPIVGGLLMAFSRPIARMISWQASSASPGAPTVGEFTRVGVFLLGLFALLNGLPFVMPPMFNGMEVGLNNWLTTGFGLLLVLLASPIGDLLQRLRGQT